MKLINDIVIWFMKKRFERIEHFKKYPVETQQIVLEELLQTARYTEWGQRYNYGQIKNAKEFAEQVPVSSYEDLFPFIERVLKGEPNVLWPTISDWFSKSSGTTNARSKFIPVSAESLEECHYKGGKDMMTLLVQNRPDTSVFDGKGLSIGGTLHANPYNPDTKAGDISAIIVNNLPAWAQYLRTPTLEIALLDEWETKIARMVETCSEENVTNMLGVPTWAIVLLDRIMEKKGASNMMEIWPDFQVFVHGAVAFTPYRDLFKTKYFPSSSVDYLEVYNASEGYIAVQDDLSKVGEMLLMLDYGIYYEFVPMSELHKKHPRTLTLDEVELNTNYALVMSTNAGLWRYLIGDTIKFTSKYPFRIKVSGRTKHFINAFGEEVIVENADISVTEACSRTGAKIKEFTAAPIFMDESGKGGHEWIFEFETQPADAELFNKVLDEKLREVNSDYDAKRYKDMALLPPVVHHVPTGTFYRWMSGRGQLGGQHKVPRLSNDRKYVDGLLELMETSKIPRKNDKP